ncbi:MAG TPA: c-type cytochrome domain-containing protein [Thiobacillaceae bacterium]|nr:c-type cytochrome domain-containing protein [Thiobacillaceae bacterium]
MKALYVAMAASAVMLGACGQKEKVSPVSFAAQVKPILDQNCVECHKAAGQGYSKSGLRLDSYESLMAGTKFGPVVKPGSAISSSLYLLVAGKADPSIRMPHNREPLPSASVELIKNWIDQGAKDN